MPDFDALEQEHDAPRKLSRPLTGTSDSAGKTRSALPVRIETRRVGRAKGEEAVLHPALRTRGDDENLGSVAAAFEAHRAVEKTVLPGLGKAAPAHRRFAGIWKVPKAFRENHSTTAKRKPLDKQHKA